MPSTIARAAYDATTGDKSFAGSMIEGNEGLGHPVVNLAFDVLAPYGTAKGFKYASEAIPKFARFGISNHTGNWTRFGNNMYRLKPGYVGMNGVQMERRAVIIPEDLTNRKFFSVEEYGPEPIYTRKTVPEEIELRRDWNVDPLIDNPDLDITYMDYNFDHTNPMSPMEVIKNMSERFNKSAHGRAVGFDEHRALSTDSYPLALAQFKRLHDKELGTFFIPE